MDGPTSVAAGLLSIISQLADGTSYEVSQHGHSTSLTIPGSPIATIFEAIDDNYCVIYFYCGTTSWNWVGERTDLHDVASNIFAAALRTLAGVSCSLRDIGSAVGHPSELSGRYIVPEQPSAHAMRIDQIELESSRLMMAAGLGHDLLHSLEMFAHGTEHQDFSFGSRATDSWLSQVCEAVGLTDPGDALTYFRTAPTWKYFRSGELGLTVLQDPALSRTVRRLSAREEKIMVNLPSPNGMLILVGQLRNVMFNSSCLDCEAILLMIETLSTPAPFIPSDQATFIVLEDSLIAALGDYVLFMEDETGSLAHDRERAALLVRHAREAEHLLPGTAFSWSNPVSPVRFEDLICELLEREPGMRLVRKSGSTFDRDAGRDILIDRVLRRGLTKEPLGKEQSPLELLHLVGQCKASSNGKTVGNATVVDVHDTIERHSAQGYFLAVSTQLSNSVVEKLDLIRRKSNYHIDWWTSVEIEQRLRQHPDIAGRYRDVLKEA